MGFMHDDGEGGRVLFMFMNMCFSDGDIYVLFNKNMQNQHALSSIDLFPFLFCSLIS